MKKYTGFIASFNNLKNDPESTRDRNNLLVWSLMLILIMSAVTNAVFFVIFRQVDSLSAWLSSAVFLILAGALYLVYRSVRSEKLMSKFSALFFVVTLFFIVWRYYFQIGPAVWTVAFSIIILATISNNKLTLWALSVCLLLVGIVLWIKKFHYDMGNLYYAAQFVAFAVLFIVSAGIQTLNLERFKKIDHYLSETELISKISSDLITVNAENLDEKINAMLARSAEYLGVERSVVFLLSKDLKIMTYSYEWCAEGQEPFIGVLDSFEVASRDEWVDQVENKTVWIIPDVDQADEKTTLGKKNLQDMNVKAMISMPFDANGRIRGVLFYESHTKPLEWGEKHLKMMVVLTNLLSDTFSKVESEEKINVLAYTDTLTGLPNRIYFNEKLEQTVADAKEKNVKTAVVFIDLDAFKSVNDTMGHEGGDEVLKIMGQRLMNSLPPGGVAARFGGDEFIMMIPDIGDIAELKKNVMELMRVFNQPLSLKGMSFSVMASAGVAVYPDDSDTARQLIKNADHAMYAAKEQGKNQVVFCTRRLKEELERKAWLTNQLYRPQLTDELVLEYQPLVDLETKSIVGFESLVRWEHPEIGRIQPNDFISLAEQTGLINHIGEWVLREACRQNKQWQDAGLRPVRMSVNLSVKQFLNSDLLETVKRTLSETGLEPRYLELEITESTAVNQAGYIPGMLEEIRALGVSISIDDFGSEYSSLTRITQLPIDRIKMDMQFVKGIAVREKDETIAKIIINLAGSLGFKVVAEGVETKKQLDFLKKRICDEVQGFYLYRPMPASEVENVLEAV